MVQLTNHKTVIRFLLLYASPDAAAFHSKYPQYGHNEYNETACFLNTNTLQLVRNNGYELSATPNG